MFWYNYIFAFIAISLMLTGCVVVAIASLSRDPVRLIGLIFLTSLWAAIAYWNMA